jgi:hypothetical protein
MLILNMDGRRRRSFPAIDSPDRNNALGGAP